MTAVASTLTANTSSIRTASKTGNTRTLPLCDRLAAGPVSSSLSSISGISASWSPQSVRTVVPQAKLERQGLANDNADDANASGARLIIPAISLRSVLSKPTRTGRVSCLMDVPSFAPPPGLDQTPESKPFEPTPISSPAPSPLSLTAPSRGAARLLPAESTVPMRRPWRIGKTTGAACGFGGVLVILGLVASTTDAAESIAARIHLAFQADAIPAAAADPAIPGAAAADPTTPTAVQTSLTDTATREDATQAAPALVELETPAAQPGALPAARAVPVKRFVARPVARPASSMPIRLRSPY